MTGVWCDDACSGGLWSEKGVKEPGQARTFHTEGPGDGVAGCKRLWSTAEWQGCREAGNAESGRLIGDAVGTCFLVRPLPAPELEGQARPGLQANHFPNRPGEGPVWGALPVFPQPSP